MRPFSLAKLSLTRHPFSTFVTVLAISLSVACGGLLLRLHTLTESRFTTLAPGGDAIVGAKAGGIEILLNSLNGEGQFPDFLPYKLFESLRAEQAVMHSDGKVTRPSYIDVITPFVYFAKYKDFRVIGTDESILSLNTNKHSLTLAKGRWLKSRDEVVLGYAVAQKYQLNIGNEITVQSWVGNEAQHLQNLKLKIVGVFSKTNSQWDRSLFSSVEQAHLTFNEHSNHIGASSIWGAQVLHFFLVRLRPDGFLMLESLINKRTVGQVILIDEQVTRLKELSNVGSNVGLLVTIFVILLGGLSVCSTLVTRFDGMGLQLAMLRAIGYTKAELAKWLLWEGFLLGVAGVVAGALLDLLVLPFLRSQLGTALPPAEIVSSPIYESLPIWIIAITATVLSVVIPVIRMLRQDPHSALRGL